MLICLKTAAKQVGLTHTKVTLTERLPFYIVSDCDLTCDFGVKSYPDYYLLTLDVSGKLAVHCQRCLNVFHLDYANFTELAVCRDEVIAAGVMEDYECIVSANHQVDLVSILTDELYLYVPEKHADLSACERLVVS